MKMLFRWTFGITMPAGLECLKISLRQVKKFFPDAYRVVCYNGNGKLDVDCDEVIYQKGEGWVGTAWKFGTPRLLPDGFEIYLDNDLVFLEKIPLEKWQPWWGFACEDIMTIHGAYQHKLPPGYSFNSGLFGLPPGFEFDELVKKHKPDKWVAHRPVEGTLDIEYHCEDEQGLVGYIFYKYLPHWLLGNKMVAYLQGPYYDRTVLHFVGLNKLKFHQAFNEFRQKYPDL